MRIVVPRLKKDQQWSRILVKRLLKILPERFGYRLDETGWPRICKIDSDKSIRIVADIRYPVINLYSSEDMQEIIAAVQKYEESNGDENLEILI